MEFDNNRDATYDFTEINPATVSSVGRASFNGDIILLEELIKEQHSIRTKDNQGLSPIHYAAFKGHFDCLLILLDAGAEEVNATSFEGYTALDLACRAHQNFLKDRPVDQFDILVALFNAGATTDNTRELYACSLNCLIDCGNLPAVHLFLNSGGNINLCDTRYGTPLHTSIMLEQTEIMAYLLNNGATDEPLESHYGFTALHCAIAYNSHVHIMEELLSYEICIKNINNRDSKRESTALNLACFMGDIDGINMLLTKGADANLCDIIGSPFLNFSATTLDKSVEVYVRSSRECLDRLLDLTSDEIIFQESNTLMYYVIYNDHVSILQKLLARGINPDLIIYEDIAHIFQKVSTLIPYETAKLDALGLALNLSDFSSEERPGKYEIIKLLLKAGCPMNSQRIDDRKNVVPPFVAFTLDTEKLLTPDNDQEMMLLNQILQNKPDLTWNFKNDIPIPDIYLAPLFTGNLSVFIILLQWGIPAELIFTRKNCYWLLNFINKSSEKPGRFPGWYIKILNEFVPILPLTILGIYNSVKICNFNVMREKRHDIRNELRQCLSMPKSLRQLCVLSVRKQLYLINKVPLKISIDSLCNSSSYVIHKQMLCNNLFEWYPKYAE